MEPGRALGRQGTRGAHGISGDQARQEQSADTTHFAAGTATGKHGALRLLGNEMRLPCCSKALPLTFSLDTGISPETPLSEPERYVPSGLGYPGEPPGLWYEAALSFCLCTHSRIAFALSVKAVSSDILLPFLPSTGDPITTTASSPASKTKAIAFFPLRCCSRDALLRRA